MVWASVPLVMALDWKMHLPSTSLGKASWQWWPKPFFQERVVGRGLPLWPGRSWAKAQKQGHVPSCSCDRNVCFLGSIVHSNLAVLLPFQSWKQYVILFQLFLSHLTATHFFPQGPSSLTSWRMSRSLVQRCKFHLLGVLCVDVCKAFASNPWRWWRGYPLCPRMSWCRFQELVWLERMVSWELLGGEGRRRPSERWSGQWCQGSYAVGAAGGLAKMRVADSMGRGGPGQEE